MEIPARRLKAASFIYAIWFASSMVPANAQIPVPDPTRYGNANYQFSVDLPGGLPACISEHTNHGVVIYLDRAVRCRDTNEGMPYIGVFANYNSAEAENLTALAQFDCRASSFGPVPRRVERPRDMTLSGRRAIGCRQFFKDGVLISVITLRKTGPDVSVWIEIAAHLRTTVERYNTDMDVFRRMLRGIWIHPDGPLQ